jgi:hypothetical protein
MITSSLVMPGVAYLPLLQTQQFDPVAQYI